MQLLKENSGLFEPDVFPHKRGSCDSICPANFLSVAPLLSFRRKEASCIMTVNQGNLCQPVTAFQINMNHIKSLFVSLNECKHRN